ncbi:MAG TPA: PASTA domain-containing protein [Candidatus Eisenbacteria bacterium]|nr:PASTA domain-containing protein [Candidatus Eisenbacteria bacterium]
MREPLTETREPGRDAEDLAELPSAMGPDLEPSDPDPPAPRSERRRGFRFNLITGTLALAAVALFGGFLVVNLILMPSFVGQGAEVHVPEVIGLSEREAEKVLASEDLKLSKISEQWSPDVPRGFITEQDPPAGGLVKRGRRISVIVSLGAQGTSVPVLEGVTARQATMLLENAGLKLGHTARAYADDVGKDLVIASDPPGETMVEQDAAVDLLVSLGPVPRSFVLPDLSGHDGSAAARGLRDQGIAVAIRESRGAEKSGDVNSQSPPPGRRVAPRDSVILFVQP